MYANIKGSIMQSYSIIDKKYDQLVPVEMVKRHLWIDDCQNEDILLQEIVKCAIDAAEAFLGRCIVEQTVLYRAKISSNKSIRLPIASASTFISCKQNSEEISTTEQLMDHYNEATNKIKLLNARPNEIVEVLYVAKWTQGPVPQDIIQGVLQHTYNIHHKQSLSLIQNNDSVALYQPYRRLML